MLFLLIGIVLFLSGMILKLFPPRKINGIYGYRTSLSMKNQDTWDVAQRLSAKSFMLLGCIYIVIGLILLLINKDTEDIQAIFFIIGVIAMLIVDEFNLRKIFNKDGTKKVIK